MGCETLPSFTPDLAPENLNDSPPLGFFEALPTHKIYGFPTSVPLLANLDDHTNS